MSRLVVEGDAERGNLAASRLPAVAMMMRVIRAFLVPASRRLGGSPWTTPGLLENQNPLLRRRPKTTESEPPPVMPSRLESADSHGGREHDACFSSMPRSRRRLLRGLPWIEISQSPEGQNSLVAGKKAGNLFDSAVFCENPSRKHLSIQSFADEFPTRTEQGIFLPGQGINLARREWQGISAQDRSARPDASDSAKMLLRDG